MRLHPANGGVEASDAMLAEDLCHSETLPVPKSGAAAGVLEQQPPGFLALAISAVSPILLSVQVWVAASGAALGVGVRLGFSMSLTSLMRAVCPLGAFSGPACELGGLSVTGLSAWDLTDLAGN